MSAILTELLTLLVSGISTFANGLGSGLKALVEAIFLDGAGTVSDPYVLSTFGGVVVIFAAVSLTIALSRWVMMFITSIGAKH